MRHRLSTATLGLVLVVSLVATLCVGCGDSGGETRTTIVIGHISDMTGPASPALVPINYALEDLAYYYNTQERIPGVRLVVAAYDGMYDPSRILPGWEWVKERRAKVVCTALPPAVVTLEPFAEKESIPVFSLTSSTGPWAFCGNVSTYHEVKTILKWVAENDWDYQAEGRVPRIGFVGWQESYAIDCRDGMRDYCDDHPDQFEWGGGFLAPMGSATWSGEIGQLKTCDYVMPPTTGVGTVSFIKQFRDAGYTAKFIGTDAHAAYESLAASWCGWDNLNGMRTVQISRFWNEDFPMTELAKQLLQERHAAEYSEIIESGVGYIGGFTQLYAFFEILAAAVENVGAESFDGQAFYNAAISYDVTWEGFEKWNYTETKRNLPNDVGLFLWSAQHQDIVRELPGWLPLVIE